MADLAGAPADVVDAVRAFGFEPISVMAIGASPGWREGRSTYRVDVLGGGSLKARRLPGRVDKAARAASLATAVAHPGIPVPVGFRGPIVVDRWVEGDPLDTRRLTGALVDAAAGLLAQLHAVDAVPGARLPRTRSTSSLRAETEAKLAELEGTGAVERADVALLRRLLQGLPARAPQGVLHGDLCAANLVVTDDARVVSIDNEGLRVGFFGYDLARTWCRWPMPPWAHDRFRRRYADRFPLAATPEADAAWRTVTAVKSAYLWRGAESGPGKADATAVVRRLVAGAH